jgi:hypothetical protein
MIIFVQGTKIIFICSFPLEKRTFEPGAVMAVDNYHILIMKLDEFIRKYYKNLLIQGVIFFIALLTVFFLVTTLTEFFGRFDTTARTIIFYSFLSINGFILWRLILIPVFKLLRFGKIISHEDAAAIIGKHFPEIGDKLLNTLQLKALQEQQNSDLPIELIKAGIDQKIKHLRPVPFTLAIDLKKNSKYLRYALPPVIIIILILILSPRVITEPSERIVKYQRAYVPPAPFSIIILNDKLETFQQEDYVLDIKVEGTELPSDLYLEMNGIQYRMDKKSPVLFNYKFRNIQETKRFVVTNDIFRSGQFELLVFPKPIVLSFEASLDYPGYTGKTDETLENTGDFIIPVGTVIKWKFFTRDTRSIFFRQADALNKLDNVTANSFSYSETALKSFAYSVISANEHLRNADSLNYSVSVVPDNYPSITVDQVRDSIFDKRIYFRGLIKDDYGFSKLTFNYRIDPEGKEKMETTEYLVELPVSRMNNQQQFFHFFDLDSINIEPGAQIEYHFEVWDNDGVNGNKVTRSQPMIFRAPTLEEIEEKTKEDNEQIKDDLEKSIQEAKKLQNRADELSRKLIDKENIGWQEKEQIQELIDDQKKLQEKIEQIQEENQIKSIQEQQYKKIDEELVRKQERLEKLFDEVMTEEMRKLFEELQKMLDNIDKDKINEMLEQMQMDNKDLEKQLDRNLELFKQLEFEKKLQDAIDKMKELAAKQEETAKKGEEDKTETEKLKNEQDNLNEQFDQLRKELDELEKMNGELEEPNSLKNTDQEEESIRKDMEESLEQLNQGNPGKASPSQRNASQKMKMMAEQMEQMQGEMYSEELGENIETLREILENLVQLSFDQEELIRRTAEISVIDPQYPTVIETQKRIQDDLVMVEDSLWALGKRQQIIEPVITREIQDINHHVDKALEDLTERRKGPAAEDQQFVMTSVNNLALLLAEALEQMENAMQMQCSGQCKKGSPKPGKGSASMKTMREMQQQLNRQIEQMKENGKTPSKKGRNTAQSEGFARMAAQQEAIRRMMGEYQDQMKEQGMGNSKELREMMDQMEQTETELVNKIITQQTIDRLNEIETRLLKHEKAELKREQEEKRESREGKDINKRNPDDFLEYNRIQDKEIELLRTVPPNLRPYYKEKVNQYFYHFESM